LPLFELTAQHTIEPLRNSTQPCPTIALMGGHTTVPLFSEKQWPLVPVVVLVATALTTANAPDRTMKMVRMLFKTLTGWDR